MSKYDDASAGLKRPAAARRAGGRRSPRPGPALATVVWLTLAASPLSMAQTARLADNDPLSDELPVLDTRAPDYRTPLAGQGFRTEILGEEVTVPVRDLRHVPATWGNFEYGLTLQNFTLPEPWNEAYEGQVDKSQQIYWGWVRPGLTFGYRRELDTGHQDNMWQINWVLEPSYFYSGRSGETSPDMVLPKSTFELRNRLMLRYDRMERNILSLPHKGYAFGANFVQGYRANWAGWGTPDNFYTKQQGQNYSIFTAYGVASGRLPLIDQERHRWVSWFTAGVGHNVDRFNAPRVGGGPNAMGMEYGSSAMPMLPGTSIWGFYPEHYMIGAVEYRWELAWFSYLSAHTGVGWLDPYRATATGRIDRTEQLLPWIGARISTGFFGDTMLMLDYAHSFNNVNNGTRGTNEVMLWVSGEF